MARSFSAAVVASLALQAAIPSLAAPVAVEDRALPLLAAPLIGGIAGGGATALAGSILNGISGFFGRDVNEDQLRELLPQLSTRGADLQARALPLLAAPLIGAIASGGAGAVATSFFNSLFGRDLPEDQLRELIAQLDTQDTGMQARALPLLAAPFIGAITSGGAGALATSVFNSIFGRNFSEDPAKEFLASMKERLLEVANQQLSNRDMKGSNVQDRALPLLAAPLIGAIASGGAGAVATSVFNSLFGRDFPEDQLAELIVLNSLFGRDMNVVSKRNLADVVEILQKLAGTANGVINQLD